MHLSACRDDDGEESENDTASDTFSGMDSPQNEE